MEITNDNKKKLKILAVIGGVCMAGLVALNFVGGDKEEAGEEAAKDDSAGQVTHRLSALLPHTMQMFTASSVSGCRT